MIHWRDVMQDLPLTSDKCLVTDGKSISTAHWFSALYNPVTNRVELGEWVNQHTRLSGEYIETITHWMPLQECLDFLLYFLGSPDYNKDKLERSAMLGGESENYDRQNSQSRH